MTTPTSNRHEGGDCMGLQWVRMDTSWPQNGEDYAYDPADVTIVRRHPGGHEAREENTDA